MFYKLQSYIALTLSIINLVFADTSTYQSNVWSQSQNGVGALITLSNNAPTELGFKATVYSFPWLSFWDYGYIGASYTTNGIVTTIDSIDNPNFSLPGSWSWSPDGYTLYDHPNVALNQTLIELKGYFSRMYFLFLIIASKLICSKY